MSWVSVSVAAIGVGSSVYKGLKSKSQDKQASAEGNALHRPDYRIPDEYFQNKNILAEQATGGLSAGEKQYAGEQRERALGSSLKAIGQAGGGPNDFSGLNEVFNDSLRNQSALDAQTHLQNIQMFTNANKDLAGQKATKYGINELQPYESKLKEIQDRRIAAQTNANNATDEALGYAGAAGTALTSRPPSGGNTRVANPVDSTPYSRVLGIENTSGDAPGSPAAGWNALNPNAADSVLVQQ